jgi:hypothetical protein
LEHPPCALADKIASGSWLLALKAGEIRGLPNLWAKAMKNNCLALRMVLTYFYCADYRLNGAWKRAAFSLRDPLESTTGVCND